MASASFYSFYSEFYSEDSVSAVDSVESEDTLLADLDADPLFATLHGTTPELNQ